MRRAARRDSSEGPIVETLIACGWVWCAVNEPNKPDAFIAKQRRTVAVEIKTGKCKLKPGQVKFRDSWPGEYVVLRTPEDALRFHKGETL